MVIVLKPPKMSIQGQPNHKKDQPNHLARNLFPFTYNIVFFLHLIFGELVWSTLGVVYEGEAVSRAEGAGRAGLGPRREFRKFDGRTGPRPIMWEFDGPGRAESFENLMGRTGPRPIMWKFDGPGRAGPGREF